MTFHLNHLHFLESKPCVIIAGDFPRRLLSFVEVLTGDLKTRKLKIKTIPHLPDNIVLSSMVWHNGTILLCGGWPEEYYSQKCFQWRKGSWKRHSILNRDRRGHSLVKTQKAIFVFGDLSHSWDTYEYLPKDSTTWIIGETLIPCAFYKQGYIIAIESIEQIWFIGCSNTYNKILSFDYSKHTFKELPLKLNVGRYGHRCAFIPNTNKIMITGGYNSSKKPEDSTEILDIEDGSVTMTSPMNSVRARHGMGIVPFKGEDRLAVFGGSNGDEDLGSVEVYNSQTKKWETTDLKLNRPRRCFSFLQIKLGDIIS